MEELIKEISDKLESIGSASGNAYMEKMCNIISIKLEDVEKHRYSMIETVQSIVDTMVNNEISNMKGIMEQPEEVYTMIDELEVLVKQIPEKY